MSPASAGLVRNEIMHDLPRPLAGAAGRDRDITGCGKTPVATAFSIFCLLSV